jgi:hypothetical protein
VGVAARQLIMPRAPHPGGALGMINCLRRTTLCPRF